LSPIGAERLDVLAALLRYEIALPWSRQRPRPGDFLVQWDHPADRKQDPEMMSQMIKQWGRLQRTRPRRKATNGHDS